MKTQNDTEKFLIEPTNFQNEISRYRSIDKDVTVDPDELEIENQKFIQKQSEIFKEILDAEESETIQKFWKNILTENLLETEAEISEAIEILHANVRHGILTQNIFRSFESIETFNLQNFFKVKNMGGYK